LRRLRARVVAVATGKAAIALAGGAGERTAHQQRLRPAGRGLLRLWGWAPATRENGLRPAPGRGPALACAARGEIAAQAARRELRHCGFWRT
jgi:hypothetical protein